MFPLVLILISLFLILIHDKRSLLFFQALIECQGDSIDLSGDMGAVGRIIISDSPSGDQEMYLDLKGILV